MNKIKSLCPLCGQEFELPEKMFSHIVVSKSRTKRVESKRAYYPHIANGRYCLSNGVKKHVGAN